MVAAGRVPEALVTRGRRRLPRTGALQGERVSLAIWSSGPGCLGARRLTLLPRNWAAAGSNACVARRCGVDFLGLRCSAPRRQRSNTPCTSQHGRRFSWLGWQHSSRRGSNAMAPGSAAVQHGGSTEPVRPQRADCRRAHRPPPPPAGQHGGRRAVHRTRRTASGHGSCGLPAVPRRWGSCSAQPTRRCGARRWPTGRCRGRAGCGLEQRC